MDFRDQVVIVTGASSGIGWATARAFAAQGAIVVAVARREERLAALIEACRGDSPRSSYLAGDLGVRSFAERMVHETVERYGGLHVLVNNAAVPHHELVYRIPVEAAEDTLRINFLSCLWTTWAAIPPMLARGGGTIVNVSSFATVVTPNHEAVYAASKGAMDGLSRGLWNDLRGSGIHVCLVHPGAIATEIWDKLPASAYQGPKHPPEVVARAILDAVRKRRFEVTVPRFDPRLLLARWLSRLAPGLVRAGAARMDPVEPRQVAEARRRAKEGKRLGEEMV